MKTTKNYESPSLFIQSVNLAVTLLTGSPDAASFTFVDPFEDEVTF